MAGNVCAKKQQRTFLCDQNACMNPYQGFEVACPKHPSPLRAWRASDASSCPTQATAMMHILVLAVLLAAGGAAAFEPNTGSSLLVQAGACSAFEFTPQPAHKFSYTLKLLSVGAAGCDRGLVR